MLDEILERLNAMTPDQLAELQRERSKDQTVWIPTAGPQLEAFESEADELFYGGSAGGGKTDLIVGLSLTAHIRSLVLRRTNKEASKLVERYVEVLGHRDGWNGQEHTWRLPDGRLIDIGGVQHEDDRQKYKGTPHDLVAWDEVSDFTETQFRFINIWNRSANPDQRCRVVCAGNPPTQPEGLWVIKYWGPWLDPTHPNPAKPGELRWFTTIDGKDKEVDGPGPYLIGDEWIRARSRTFVPAKLSDNPDLARTNYAAVLAALPEELRAAYKDGRFDSVLADGEAQLIPTAWIIAAQDRWTRDGGRDEAMSAMAFDPAGGGRDDAVLAWRHGGWYAPIIAEASPKTADGSWSAALIATHRRNRAPVVVDVGGGAGHGFGGTTIMRLADSEIEFRKFNGVSPSMGKTEAGHLRFANKRAEAWWRFREALDPDQTGGSPIALPPDPELRADLAAPTFVVKANGILVEDKKDIKKRIGRSPGRGDAVVMCYSEGNAAIHKAALHTTHGGQNATLPTQANLGGRRLHADRVGRRGQTTVYPGQSSSYRDEQG